MTTLLDADTPTQVPGSQHLKREPETAGSHHEQVRKTEREIAKAHRRGLAVLCDPAQVLENIVNKTT